MLCFGEMLWDFLPAGLFAGGAPLNVAFHLHALGCDAQLVSAVGRDALGDELIRRLGVAGMSARHVGRVPACPTGHVLATLDRQGNARYDIASNVAWDHIPVADAELAAARLADALVFGSLALRSRANRDALVRLLDALAPQALRVFDVNLRPPFDDLDRVREFARRATLVKVNAEEAARLVAQEAAPPGREESHARAIAEASGCAMVCVTAGERGAGLLRGSAWTWEAGRTVVVADTVGAGDAFLAALVAGLFAGETDAAALARACRLGEWVASHAGAMPGHPAGEEAAAA